MSTGGSANGKTDIENEVYLECEYEETLEIVGRKTGIGEERRSGWERTWFAQAETMMKVHSTSSVLAVVNPPRKH